MAGYKTILMGLLIVLVAFAGLSSVFTEDDAFLLTFNPPEACPGERVTFALPPIIVTDIVGGGGGMSVAAVSPLGAFGVFVVQDPPGLLGPNSDLRCTDDSPVECTFLVSESASCGRYTVTVGVNMGDSVNRILGSAPFDVAGSCCPAVGGLLTPADTLALVAPWLIAIGLVGCISTVVVVAKKR